jgi:molybdate transport system regulatory protein
MDTDVEVSLSAGEVTFEPSDAALLRAVDSEGSLNAAATSLGRSYSRAHKRLTTLEAALGPLVERERGGEGGGGSSLTDGGREMLTRFARVRAVLAGTAAADEIALTGTVRERSGRLVAVDSRAGELHAIAADESGAETAAVVAGDDVTVTLTADAVTIQDPAASPSDDRTSARNRLCGTVTDVEGRDGVATVTVDVGAAAPLAVLVTEASRERLGLDPGTEVVATFKATAARATPRSGG